MPVEEPTASVDTFEDARIAAINCVRLASRLTESDITATAIYHWFNPLCKNMCWLAATLPPIEAHLVGASQGPHQDGGVTASTAHRLAMEFGVKVWTTVCNTTPTLQINILLAQSREPANRYAVDAKDVAAATAVKDLRTRLSRLPRIDAERAAALIDIENARSLRDMASTNPIIDEPTSTRNKDGGKPRKNPREPSRKAIQCYRLLVVRGDERTQSAIAKDVYGDAGKQSQVSRDIKAVKAWIAAGHVLPDLEENRPKVHAVDPARLDQGPRRDRGRA